MADGKIGIALGSGAARGWAHIGILKRLAAAGIKPDIVVGTSIGAVVGGCYAAGKLQELQDFAGSLTKKRIFGYLDLNLTGSGLINGHRLGDTLETHLENLQIENLEHDYAAVATEIGSGHEVWLTRGRLVDAMRASYALPGIFKPVRLDQRWLFDGALVNPIPVTVCRALGARFVIAVNLNGDVCGRGTIMRDQAALPDADEGDAGRPLRGKNGKAAMSLIRRQLFGGASDAPGISTVMLDAFNIVQDRIARSRLAGDPPDVTIAPRLGGIGLFEFHRAEELMALGTQAADRHLDEISRAIDGVPGWRTPF